MTNNQHHEENAGTAPASEDTRDGARAVGTSEADDDAVASLQNDLDKFRDLALRSQADLDNFRKRSAREREDAVRYANASLIERLLPVLDNFALGLDSAERTDSDEARSIRSGLEMVHRQFREALAEAGLEEIPAAGEVFDPNRHEAVAQEPSDTVPEGRVIRELRKGYLFRGRLLRASNVVVSAGPPPNG